MDEHQRDPIIEKTSQEDFFTLALVPVPRSGLFATITGARKGFRARQKTLDAFIEHKSRLRTQPHEKNRTMEKRPITRNGYERLRAELSFLCRFVRPQVIEALYNARSYGYKANNLQFFAARERQAFVEGRIEDLRRKISLSEIVVGQRLISSVACFGATVGVEDIANGDRATYQLVGPFEADAMQGRISIDSPMGSTLLGRRPGDEVTVYAPGGVRSFRLLFIVSP